MVKGDGFTPEPAEPGIQWYTRNMPGGSSGRTSHFLLKSILVHIFALSIPDIPAEKWQGIL